jgi:glycosyltransferase involved in cell wall biosynthesis
MRLLYVVNSLNFGGAENLVVQMSRSFSREFEISVVCLDEPGLWAPVLRGEGIPVHCLWRQPGLDVGMAVKLARYCKERSIDVIHAHQCTPWFYSALSRLIHRAPKLVFEEHGRFFPEVQNRKRALFNKLVIEPLTHRMVAISEDTKRRLEKYEGLDGARIEVVYNGARARERLDPAERERLREGFGVGREDFLVGTVGRCDPIKNLPLLLESIGRARESASNVRGLIVGNGPVFEEMKGMRDRYGLSAAVAMPGYRLDAERLIQCMDLFVLSSFSEGTSVALLEAMAAGVPVAATRVGGNPEIVEEGGTGWMVPSDSVAPLAAAILEAVRDGRKRERLGEAGFKRFEEKFGYEAMIDNYRGIYAALQSGALNS